MGPAVLKPVWNAFDFRIYNMDETGKPAFVYHPHDGIATIVIKPINLLRGMLREKAVISSFEEVAMTYCGQTPNAWFLQEKQPEVAINEYPKAVAHFFLDSLQSTWPFMVVSDKLKNPACSAFTARREWHGDFDIAQQYIALNGLVSKT